MKQLNLFTKLILATTIAAPLTLHTIAEQATQRNKLKTATKVTVEQINGKRVQMAQDAYTFNARLAPFVKYPLMLAGTSLFVYLFYKWYTSKSTLSDSDIELVKEYLKNNAVKQSEKDCWSLSTAKSIGSFIATQASLSLAMAGGTIGVSYANILIPATGNLDWYIMNRTAYAQNITYLKQSFTYYTIFKESVATTAHLLMRDIEKILGYLAYCKEVAFLEKSSAVQMALHDRALFIEEHANAFAQLINDDQPLEKILAAMTLLETDIAHAIKFIGVYS